ncbi:unnamed protein product [marine sediment metagenome]|uniref:Uncharacterized protein n=1 Tax=marine sediment metagenome TaxID=412755 RepID=X1P1K2_9ZZZZ
MSRFCKKPDDYLVKAESYKANNRKYQEFGSLAGERSFRKNPKNTNNIIY